MHVIRAAALCRPNIDCLNLHTYARGLDFGMLCLSDRDLTLLMNLLRGVSKLAFAIPSKDRGEYRYYTPESQPFQILRTASNLRHLDLFGNSMGRPDEFRYTLRECFFARLYFLELCSVVVDGKDLIGVVQRHR